MDSNLRGNTKDSCHFCMYLCQSRKSILGLIWLTVIGGWIVNFLFSWSTSKNIDVSETPLGQLLHNPWMAATFGLGLLLITVIFGFICPLLEQRKEQRSEPHLVPPKEASQNRERLLPLLKVVYTQQQFPLQRAARIDLELKQRFDMTLQPLHLIWHSPDHSEHPIALGTPIDSIYKQAGNGLLILGAAGAGKSTLLVDLAQLLLQQAQQDPKASFPIVLNLSSWANSQQPLENWMAEELLLRYQVPRQLTATWIHTDQLLPLLDGLDEVRDTARADCIDAINHYHQRHLLPLVVCCRSEVYPFQEHRLALQSAIEIQSLDQQEVMNYLSATPSGKTMKTALHQNKVLQELLTTPLMLQIMMLAFQGKSAKDLGLLRRLSRDEQQRYLFESYIQHMLAFRAAQGKSMPAQTISWLAWLAQQMSQHAQTDFYLERLDVSWLPPKYFHVCHIAARLLVGLFFGLFGGLTGWQTLRLAGELANQLGSWQIFRLAGELASLLGGWQTLELVGGLVGALISWLVSGQIIEQIINYVSRPTEVITLSWKTILRGLGMVLLIGLPNGLGGWLFVTIENGRLEEKLFVGLGMGLTFGLLAGLFTGLPTQQLNERARAIPNQGISRSRENALRMGLSIGLLACIGGGLVGYLIDELVFGLVHALLFGLSIGLLSALMGGLFAGLHYGGVTYINHYILRLMLSHLGYLPRHYEQFLDVAADCILLQKVGGGYRFIHQEFLKYFALLDTPMPTHKAKAQATQSSSSQTS